MAKKKVVSLTMSDFAENFFMLSGEQFSLDDYPHMRRIYNTPAQDIVMKFSRQTAKSTTLANMLLTRALMRPYLRQLYVSPAKDQTEEFSRDKIQPVIDTSPIIQQNFLDPNRVQRVLKKEFANGSVINMRYALLNADRVRGISADINLFDETQDLLKDVITVIRKTMARSEIKNTIYAGTPKRTKGTLADLWYKSTQYEYIIKCEACNHWNILGPENIGRTGLICEKCGTPMDLRHLRGEWVSTFTNKNKMPDMEGYRVCLLHFAHSPWVNWEKDVIYEMENVSKALFYNETLGLEYDAGSIPITTQEIVDACNPNFEMTGEPDKQSKGRQSIMGIDYGPVNSENSHTVITIAQEREGKIQIVYAKKFLGKEAEYSFIHEEVPRLMKKWNCAFLAADYGMGEAPNSIFKSRLGIEKVLQFQHLDPQKEVIRYNPKMPAYTLNRTYIMTRFFHLLKTGKILLPQWEDTEPFAKDLQNVVIEYDEKKNKQKFVNIGPDDFVHSSIFAVVTAAMHMGVGHLLQ